MKIRNTLILLTLLVPKIALAQDHIVNDNISGRKDSIAMSPQHRDHIPFSIPTSFPPSVFRYPAHPALHLPATWKWQLNDTTAKPRFLYRPFNRQTRYPGLGNYNNLGTSLSWMPAKRLYTEGGVFLSKQYGFILSSRHIAYGAHLGLNYQLTGILLLRLRGQYLTPAPSDPFIRANNLFPRSKAGAALIVKPKDYFELGIGVEYQYHEKEHHWKSKSGGKISVGF